jgi:lysophospholipase L1-like esterase
MDLDEEYQAWCNEDYWKDFVEYVDLAGQFDSEYNLPSKQKAVNTRCETTEVLGTNGVHPANSGYMQIADAVYRNVVASFMHE